jgi:hypothetical protein
MLSFPLMNESIATSVLRDRYRGVLLELAGKECQ